MERLVSGIKALASLPAVLTKGYRGRDRTNRRLLWLCAVLLTMGVAAGCALGEKHTESTATTKQGASSSMVVGENGLTTNGLIQNGLLTNGYWSNGYWSNGYWSNGYWSNGYWSNGYWSNGYWSNGYWSNGLWSNSFWTTGLPVEGGFLEADGGVLQADAAPPYSAPGVALRSSQYARQLLQYIYSCAMPASPPPGVTDGGTADTGVSNPNCGTDNPDGGPPISYDTTLDPNDGMLTCGDLNPCDVGYTCQYGKCVIPLTGQIGLGINADGTAWWETGTCDESCQRWVSACVLARTNAYGVHVIISMRAAVPPDLPADRQRQFSRIMCALSTTEDELAAFPLREGAYYGNIFGTKPAEFDDAGQVVVDDAGNPVSTPGPDGSSASPILFAPSYNACAGPGSNIPEVTKRFCSSQGDQVVISVPGVCEPASVNGTVPSADAGPVMCNGIANPTTGAVYSCNTASGTRFDEVITVYLKQPIAVCGNTVCEFGETDPCNPNYCPSDCHPGSWAKDIAPNLEQSVVNQTSSSLTSVVAGMSVVAPDDTIIVAGTSQSDINLGGSDAGTLSGGQGVGVLVKYDSHGNYLWGARFGNTSQLPGDGGSDGGASPSTLQQVNGLAVASTGTAKGDMAVVGLAADNAGVQYLWIGLFEPNAGGQLGAWSLPIGSTSSGLSNFQPTRAVGIDSQGNIVIAGSFAGTATFGSNQLTSVPSTTYFDPGTNGSVPTGADDIFVTKVSEQGTVLWARSLSTVGEDFPLSLVVDTHLVAVASDGGSADATGADAEGSDGAAADLAAVDASATDGADAGVPADEIVLVAALGADLPPQFAFDTGENAAEVDLTKLTADGSTQWRQILSIQIPCNGECSPATLSNFFSGAAVDSSGNVYATGYVTSGIQLCGGVISSSIAGNPPFIQKYGSDGSCQWSNYANILCPSEVLSCVPSLLEGVNISFDPSGNVILGSFGDPALGGFIDFSGVVPSLTDGGVRPFPPLPTYHSNNIFLTAYTPDVGQVLWEEQIPTILSSSLLGMAIDKEGHVVVSGNYSGTMQVDDELLQTPVPQDPNTVDSFLASFLVPSLLPAPPAIGTGKDQTGAPLVTMPKDIFAEATSSEGAYVFYMLPTAIDNGNLGDAGICDGGNSFDAGAGGPPGVRVICLQPPNSLFKIGTTTVNCTAFDPFGNSSTSTFEVTVADTVGPVFTLTPDVTSSSVSVNYTVPTAIDQVDGVRPVSCSPMSGSQFPTGNTTVTCTASDTSNNQSQTTFVVTVNLPCTTCIAQGAKCGTISDGCGNTLNCGSCTAPQTCGGGGTPNVCGCTPTTCSAQKVTCGPIPDGCGNTLNCGCCPPKLNLPSAMSATATSVNGAKVTYSASATDPAGGSLTPSCTPSSGSPFPLGATTVTCSVTNSCGAQTKGTFPVQVSYSWSGILPPIATNGSSEFKLGSTVPVKFQLTGASAGITNAVATLSVAKVSSTVTGTVLEPVSTSAATTGNAFRYDSTSGDYIFNLATSNLSKGTWSLKINLGDGASRAVTISLK